MQHININPVVKLSTDLPSTTNHAGLSAPITITETNYNSSTQKWYRKYSDGWIEQGGYEPVSNMTNYGTVQISYAIEFPTTAVNVHCGIEISGATGRDAGLHGVQAVNAQGFTFTNGDQTTVHTGIYWIAKGF